MYKSYFVMGSVLDQPLAAALLHLQPPPSALAACWASLTPGSAPLLLQWRWTEAEMMPSR